MESPAYCKRRIEQGHFARVEAQVFEFHFRNFRRLKPPTFQESRRLPAEN
jgi:hypothetical protein